MSTCKEIRQKAWKTMTNKWTFRLITVATALSAVVCVVNHLVQTALVRLGITSVADYCAKCLQAKASGVSYALPTTSAYGWMIGGEAFSFFIVAVFSGILSFGILKTCFKAEVDDGRRWFADALSGFARPLELAWLLFCQGFAIACCLFLGAVACALWLVPVAWAKGALGETAGKAVEFLGYVAAFVIFMVFWFWTMYRYRYAWYLKVLHPDWSAIACVVKGRRLIDGYKWKAFCLDCSFAGWFVLAFLFFVGVTCLFLFVKSATVASAPAAAGLLVLVVVAFLALYYAIIRLGLILVLSRILFLREILAEKPLEA